jgi:hypothetical protein
MIIKQVAIMKDLSFSRGDYEKCRLLGRQPPAHVGSSLADFSTLKMEAIRSSETSVHTRSTLRHIPEDVILQVAVTLHIHNAL